LFGSFHRHIKVIAPLLPPRASYCSLREEGRGDLGHLPKNALSSGGGFYLIFFGGEVVEGKKMLFQTFFGSFNGWLVSN